MKSQASKNPLYLFLAMLAFVALTSIACANSDSRGSTLSPVIDITLSEQDLDSMLHHTYFHPDSNFDELLDVIKRVEFHDGYVTFSGERYLGAHKHVEGSFDLSLTAEDNGLKAEVIAVDIPGLDLDDEAVLEVNQELEDDFIDMVDHNYGEVEFKEVTVTEGELYMKLQVNIDVDPDMNIKVEFE
jgi:hypothetical protein